MPDRKDRAKLALSGFMGITVYFSLENVGVKYGTAGAIGFLPLILLETDRWTVPKTDAVLAVTYLALFCSLTAFGLYACGLRRVRSAHAVILMNLVPVFGVLFSFLILHEEIHLKQVTGGLITIAGVLLSVLPPGNGRRPPAAVPTSRNRG